LIKKLNSFFIFILVIFSFIYAKPRIAVIEFKGVFIENYVAQQLISYFQMELHYWTSNGKAEVDFILSDDDILSLEAKAGINTKSRSLKTYIDKYSPDIALRTSPKNLNKNGDILNISLYALSQLKDLIQD